MITHTEKNQAREDSLIVVNDYKKYNENTVETFSHYNPKTKARYFNKVSIDPNAKKFVELHVPAEKKGTKRESPVYVIVKNLLNEDVKVNSKTLGYKFYLEFQKGINYVEIAKKFNKKPANIKTELLRMSDMYNLGIDITHFTKKSHDR